MSKQPASATRMAGSLIVSIAFGLSLAACMRAPARAPRAAQDAAGARTAAAPEGAEVWARNCGRCHALRPPDEFSYDQWEVIVEHMRVRATLPAKETRTILEFLKAAEK
jgi:mono/diheme cytochrome c family protein